MKVKPAETLLSKVLWVAMAVCGVVIIVSVVQGNTSQVVWATALSWGLYLWDRMHRSLEQQFNELISNISALNEKMRQERERAEASLARVKATYQHMRAEDEG